MYPTDNSFKGTPALEEPFTMRLCDDLPVHGTVSKGVGTGEECLLRRELEKCTPERKGK